MNLGAFRFGLWPPFGPRGRREAPTIPSLCRVRGAMIAAAAGTPPGAATRQGEVWGIPWPGTRPAVPLGPSSSAGHGRGTVGTSG
jgi:hypothetical protein